MKNRKAFVTWARPYLKKKNVAAMTKKRAIKIIMAATCRGNRRWASVLFAEEKKRIYGSPSNADVCYRVMCYIYNITNKDPAYYDPDTMRSQSIKMQLRELYGMGVGGILACEKDMTMKANEIIDNIGAAGRGAERWKKSM